MHLLTMARMVPGKGVDHAIRTMSVLPDDVTLTVAGDGSERRTCERLARTLGLTGRVRFVGWVDGAEKAKLLVTCHALLLPSQYDAFGTVFLEAMAHGLPVVASHAGPMADVVPDGIAGILVEGHDPTTLAEAVMRLTNESLRSSLGRGGKDWVRRVCGVAVVGESLRATVEGLTKR
jgi:glycosyltransferase involved in cell wall biosynthesis